MNPSGVERGRQSETLSLLLIEDNRDHIEIIRRACRNHSTHFLLHVCHTIEQAKNWLAQHSADVVLVDLHLPDGSGLELLENSDGTTAAPVVLITNQGNEQHAVKAIKLGAMDYIVKSPENFQQLPHILQRVQRDWLVQKQKEQIEAALSEKQSLLATTFDTAPVGLGLYVDGKVVESNSVLREMLGFSAEEKNVEITREIVPQVFETVEEFEPASKKLLQNEQVEFETRLIRRNGGQFWAKIRVQRIDLPPAKIACVFSIEDVTSLREAIKQIKQKEAALEQTQRQLQQRIQFLSTLHAVELALIQHTEPREMIHQILEKLGSLPEICATAFFDCPPVELDSLVVDQCHTSHSRSEDLRIWLPRIQSILEELQFEESTWLTWVIRLNEEDTPLTPTLLLIKLADSQMTFGYIALFSRSGVFFEKEWREYAESLAIQTGIAIEKLNLIRNLQVKQQQLEQAYEDTILIWSLTLEMRDRESADHTLRVTNLACQLAKVLGMDGVDLKNFRYGALLHDIGKIRIPDSILLKPGSLNEEEWQIMRQHPLYAREMLSSISELERAITIPLFHHERWDGSGYPFGLKGEEIPLSARIFAVVDVWDALTSNRPYRPAWTKEAAKKYLLENRAKLFDPVIVERFLEILEQEEQKPA